MSSDIRPPAFPNLYNSWAEIKEGFLGVNQEINSQRIDVDDRLGYRRGQSKALQTVRRPLNPAIVKFDPGHTDVFFTPLHNVVSIMIQKIHITGIAGAHDNLYLSFYQDNNARLHNSSTYYWGLPGVRDDGIIVEGNEGVATSVLVNPGSPMLLAQYLKPTTMNCISMHLKDLAGLDVDYDECVVWMLLESEIWQ